MILTKLQILEDEISKLQLKISNLEKILIDKYESPKDPNKNDLDKYSDNQLITFYIKPIHD